MNDILSRIDGFLVKAKKHGVSYAEYVNNTSIKSGHDKFNEYTPSTQSKIIKNPAEILDYDLEIGVIDQDDYDNIMAYLKSINSEQAPQPQGQKVYLKPGEHSPEGTREYQGKRGGRYYLATGKTGSTGAEQYDIDADLDRQIREDPVFSDMVKTGGVGESIYRDIVGYLKLDNNQLLETYHLRGDSDISNKILNEIITRRIANGDLSLKIDKTYLIDSRHGLIGYIWSAPKNIKIDFIKSNIDTDNVNIGRVILDILEDNINLPGRDNLYLDLAHGLGSKNLTIMENILHHISSDHISDKIFIRSKYPEVRSLAMSRISDPDLIRRMLNNELGMSLKSPYILERGLSRGDKDLVTSPRYLEACAADDRVSLGRLLNRSGDPLTIPDIYGVYKSVPSGTFISIIWGLNSEEGILDLMRYNDPVLNNLIFNNRNFDNQFISQIIDSDDIDKTSDMWRNILYDTDSEDIISGKLDDPDIQTSRIALSRLIDLGGVNRFGNDNWVLTAYNHTNEDNLDYVISKKSPKLSNLLFDEIFISDKFSVVDKDDVLDYFSRYIPDDAFAEKIVGYMDINSAKVESIFYDFPGPDLALRLRDTENDELRRKIALYLREEDINESYMFDSNLYVRRVIADRLMDKDKIHQMIINTPYDSSNNEGSLYNRMMDKLLWKASSEDKIHKFDELLSNFARDERTYILTSILADAEYDVLSHVINNINNIPDTHLRDIMTNCSADDIIRLSKMERIPKDKILTTRLKNIENLGGVTAINKFRETGEIDTNAMRKDFLDKIRRVDGINIQAEEIHDDDEPVGLDEFLHHHRIHAGLRQGWLSSSNSSKSALLKEAARRLFGGHVFYHDNAIASDKKWDDEVTQYSKDNNIDIGEVESYVRDLYQMTQQLLSIRFPGKEEFTLWRGSSEDEIAEKTGEQDEFYLTPIKIRQNSISSWTLKKNVAASFGNTIFEIKVPKNEIIASYLMYSYSGFEAEILLHGSENRDGYIVPAKGIWEDITIKHG
jgi:hypothetical protein